MECNKLYVSHRPFARLRIVNLRLLLRLSLGLGLMLAANSTALGKDPDPPGQTLNDIVAVGRGRGEVLLADLAKPVERRQWRFREIPVSPSSTAVVDFELSTDGTKAQVVLADGAPRVIDLTERIVRISAGEVFASQHRLPRQLFPYAAKARVCLLDDLGQSGDRPCVEAVAAAVHDDGRVLYAYEDGRLVVVSLQSGSREELPYRVPQGANFQLLAGHRGDARDFLILVTESVANQNGAAVVPMSRTSVAKTSVTSIPVTSIPVISIPVTKIIDPRSPATPLGQFTNPTVAALSALLEFTPTIPGTSNRELVSDSTLETLAEHLKQQTPSADVAWSFYRVTANDELYAPILEFADNEPDYPSDVDIWQEIKPRAHGTSREDYQAAYASLGERRWSRCTSYVRTLSYPGTWLIEYWFYYPFDEGKSHPHVHDSEHLFVEVDKLGGTVRNVFASDHDSFVANNLYSTLVKDSPPVALPLFAMVELAKHAMAPDLNHDGRFTRCVDDDLHCEPYAFWGLRDRGSKVHFLMEPYLASMSLPRHRDGRFALADAEIIFPGLDVPSDHLVCRLEPFPNGPPCEHCDSATAEAATAYLDRHPDARVPEAIYKPYVVPWREVRLGVGIYDWAEGRGEVSLGLVGDFRHMTGSALPIPARLVLEFGWKPLGKGIALRLDGVNTDVYSRSTLFAGVGVERLITNTQGFYSELTPTWVEISERVTNGMVSPSGLHWQYGGVSYHAGYVLELPSAHKGNFTNYIGVVIRDAPSYPILFEWRVSLGFLRRRGRHDFGARAGDRNPYE
jgi:hypothetical protein